MVKLNKERQKARTVYVQLKCVPDLSSGPLTFWILPKL